MRQGKNWLAAAGLIVAYMGLTGCSHVKAFTAPTWVYTNGESRLELHNENAGRNFCLTRNDTTVCGTYEDSDSTIFSSAMAHFKRQANEVHAPEKPSNVEFKPAKGTAWTWVVQTNGSIKDDKDGVWQLVEFRQFGKTYAE